MNLVEKKQMLVDEFNRNQNDLARLSQRQQQIIGQLQLLDEMEKGQTDEGTEHNNTAAGT